MRMKRLFVVLRLVTGAVGVVGGFLLGFKVVDQSTVPFSEFFLPFVTVLVAEWAMVGRTFIPARRSMVVRADGARYWFVGALYIGILIVAVVAAWYEKSMMSRHPWN
jgi:hypothetical protein